MSRRCQRLTLYQDIFLIQSPIWFVLEGILTGKEDLQERPAGSLNDPAGIVGE
jgi:hypothetical protein